MGPGVQPFRLHAPALPPSRVPLLSHPPERLGSGAAPKTPEVQHFFEFYSMVRSSGYRSHVSCNFRRKCSTLDTLGKVPSETKATLRGPEVQAEVDSAHQGLQILGFLGPENRKPASNTLSRARMAHLLVHSSNKCRSHGIGHFCPTSQPRSFPGAAGERLGETCAPQVPGGCACTGGERKIG